MQLEKRGIRIENQILIGRRGHFVNDGTNVGKLILDKLGSDLNFVGQIDALTGREDSYGEMRDRSVGCALWMKRQGIRQGDVVVICTHNHLNTAIPCYAALYLGAAFNPLDVGMNRKEISHVIGITRPKMAFVNVEHARPFAKAAAELELNLRIIVFGDVPGFPNFYDLVRTAAAKEVEEFECATISKSDSIVVYVCSSGTTGLPKCVALSNRLFLKHMRDTDHFGLSGKHFIIFSSLYWITGTVVVFLSIAQNAVRIVVPAFEEHAACDIIQKYKVPWVFLNSTGVNRLVKSGALDKYDLSSVEGVVTGGGPLLWSSQKTILSYMSNANLWVIYGMTEIGGAITKRVDYPKPGSSGTPMDDFQLKISSTEDESRTLGPNEEGELCLKTPFMMEYYHRNPQATANAFDREGWFRTGDIGYYDEDGEIFVIDRIKELIKFAGYQISPGEIESVLYDHPDVLQASVVSVPNLLDGEHPIAFVVKLDTSQVAEEELIERVAVELSDAKRLRGGVRFIPEMPHTPSGKIDRKELRRLAREGL